jgi:hypothetical protein
MGEIIIEESDDKISARFMYLNLIDNSIAAGMKALECRREKDKVWLERYNGAAMAFAEKARQIADSNNVLTRDSYRRVSHYDGPDINVNVEFHRVGDGWEEK